MLPVLLNLGFIKIYTFGVFLALAFFWGSFLLWKNIRLTAHKEEDIFDGVFLSLSGAVFMGRLVYVVLDFNRFGLDPLKFILINGYPGISLFGALFGGLIVLYLFFLIKKIDFKETIDYFISPIFLALGTAKLGSFFSGVEVGSKTKLPLAVKYVGFEGLRHLTPFYEALFFLGGAYLSYRILFEIRREKLPHGFLLSCFIWYFSFAYFLFDKIKVNQLYFLGYSFNGATAGVLLLTFSFYFLYYFRSSIKEYGHKTYQKIRLATKRKTGDREKKDS